MKLPKNSNSREIILLVSLVLIMKDRNRLLFPTAVKPVSSYHLLSAVIQVNF